MALKARREGKGGSPVPRKNNCKGERGKPVCLHTAIATHDASVALGWGCRSVWIQAKKHPKGKEFGKGRWENNTETPFGVQEHRTGGETGRKGKDRRTW